MHIDERNREDKNIGRKEMTSGLREVVWKIIVAYLRNVKLRQFMKNLLPKGNQTSYLFSVDMLFCKLPSMLTVGLCYFLFWWEPVFRE